MYGFPSDCDIWCSTSSFTTSATHFRDNPEMGRVFRSDYEMTYDNLKTHNFDRNAEILYALKLIDSLKN